MICSACLFLVAIHPCVNNLYRVQKLFSFPLQKYYLCANEILEINFCYNLDRTGNVSSHQFHRSVCHHLVDHNRDGERQVISYSNYCRHYAADSARTIHWGMDRPMGSETNNDTIRPQHRIFHAPIRHSFLLQCCRNMAYIHLTSHTIGR